MHTVTHWSSHLREKPVSDMEGTLGPERTGVIVTVS